MNKSWYGKIFIRLYYAISPMIVKWFGKKVWFRKFWKHNLDVFVSKLKEDGVKSTKYTDKY